MTETDSKREIAKIKGRYALLTTLITTIGVIASAAFQYYAVVMPLKEQNTELEQKNTALVKDNQQTQEHSSDMQDTVSTLENDNETLQDQYETLQSDYNAAMETMNGLNGRIAALETENAQLKEQLDGETVIFSNPSDSDTPVEGVDLLTVCPPYETAFYDALDKIPVMGVQYKKAFQLNSYRHYEYSQDGYAFFNLNRQYQSLEFDVGHVDGAGMVPKLLSVVLDGEEYLDSVLLQPDMLLKHFSIPVSGVSQMKIYLLPHQETSERAHYGFVNAKLFS